MKSKLTKKGLISNGLLLLIAVLSMAATRHAGDPGRRAVNDSTFQQLNFDTLLLKFNCTSETEPLNAPSINLNKQAALYVKDYMAKNTEMLQEIKKRSASYFKISDAIFSKYGLPVELKYLAVIESQLKTTALSHVGARGAWQLMPGTARIFSLKITAKYDERTHFYKSTVAAARYIRDLHQIFGDWLLVIAAYNSGPGRVLEAIKKSGSRNFWKLQNYLPAETRGHVKKFISTHYYFEGKGSVTTLTKEEAISYKKIMMAFLTQQNALLKEKHTAAITDIADNHSASKEEIAKAVNAAN